VRIFAFRTLAPCALLGVVCAAPLTAMQETARTGNTAASDSKEIRYRLSGERSLWPEQMSDDGEKTYLVWHPDRALPAVFAVNAYGDEEIVDGYMRGAVFTIDRVYDRLVFRIDRKAAKATRLSR
jgi:type IV secretory pathway VirB9-like protein